MQPIITLIGLALFLGLIVFPIWAIVRINTLGNSWSTLREKIRQLEAEVRELRLKLHELSPRPPEPAILPPAVKSVPIVVPPVPPVAAAPAIAVPAVVIPPEIVPAAPLLAEPPATITVSPVVEPIVAVSLPPVVIELPSAPPILLPTPGPADAAPTPSLVPETPLVAAAQPVAPKVAPVYVPPEPPAEDHYPRSPRFNWEQFMGAKLFAWLGGFAGLLAVGFFVKYSFDHDLIPPEVRVAIGFLFALGLVVGGLRIDRARYAVTAQTLIATGVVSLYTVTFACRSIYHFAPFGPVLTFLLMALITSAAFLLAVRLEAQVVAVLGILGGFLTPILVSTGQDNPLGLFTYLALLDLGLVAVALHRRWLYLVPLGAAGTILMQIAWAGKFFTDDRAVPAVVICLVFAALFLGATIFARRREQSAPQLTWSAVALVGVCYGFGLFFLGYPAVGARVGLVFSFVLFANLCLLTLAWFEGLAVLVRVAAAGTVLLLVSWAAEILTPALAPAAMGVCLGFCAFFLATYFIARRLGRTSSEVTWSAVALPCVALGFALYFIGYPAISARPGLLFTFVLLADACLLAIAWYDDEWPKLHLLAGAAVFVLLAVWTGDRLTASLLPWALAFYLLHAALHTAFPLLLERHRPATAPTWWSQLFPPLALVLMLIPLFRLEELSVLFWPCVLLVDLLAIGLAMLTASLVAVGAVLLLTLVATGVWIFHIPATVSATPSLLFVIGGFAVLFFAAGIFLARKLGDRFAAAAGSPPLLAGWGDPRAQIPALSALLPFILLIMMTARLPLANPSPVFGLALLLVVLVLGLTAILTRHAGELRAADSGEPPVTSDGPSAGSERPAMSGVEWLPACALVGVAGLEYAWRARHLAIDAPAIPLAWYLAFYAIFTAYPLVFRRQFAACTGPWAVAALGGVLQFPLVHRLVMAAWPNDFPGVLPLLFAVAPLLSLVAILRSATAGGRARLNQLALFGGVTLLFVTLIFPIQFDRQWLTLGWALEGAALLWLFHRVPHGGLRGVGAVLLVTAFARLTLNSAVFAYHDRSSAAILNWYLYSYGLVTACLFVGAALVKPPRDRLFGRINGPALFNTLGTILAFFLLNIEIADFFSEPGQRVLTFKFSGHFGRDMTYTIAWALFALGLLLVSIWKQIRAGRIAALVLLSVALLKLFFHDLARLEALYRIGALFAVAVIATVASFAYQRFLPANDKNTPPL